MSWLSTMFRCSYVLLRESGTTRPAEAIWWPYRDEATACAISSVLLFPPIS